MVRFNFYFCRMKFSVLSIFLLIFTQDLIAQDTSTVLTKDTGKADLFKVFQWTEKEKGQFEIKVAGYDSLKKGNNEFQRFFYTTKDKPDGKLTVRDENGNKVRECVYRNHLMFDEHWWFSSGQKEFDGIWSETADEYGEQVLEEYKWYYKNKKVHKHGFYSGITVTYYDTGEKESEKTFRDGKANGAFRAFYPGGKLQTEGQFLNGNKSGEWTYYNFDGTVREKGH
jgi:antitoxin component YwqK of YwqJK toxin-antitoxin module